MQPLFTIGIPTYNRLRFLKEAVAAARAQTEAGVEIVVSDNGSSDGTESWCRSLEESGIKYMRSSKNRGPAWNFANCLEAANGRYFSWLQDDDVICSDFVARAVNALEQRSADCYVASAVYSPSVEVLHWAPLYAPPVPMDWARMQPQKLGVGILAALSLFVSVGIPPVMAFRTSLLRSHGHAMFDTDFSLYAERLLLVTLGAHGSVLVAPHVAGVFRAHAGQDSKRQLAEKGDAQRQWYAYAAALDALVSRDRIDLSDYPAFIATIPTELLHTWHETSRQRERPTKFESDVYRVISSELASRTADQKPQATSPGGGLTKRLRRVAKLFCPPIVIEARNAIRRACGD